MIRFDCDYSEGAHPQILARLMETNFEQTAAYGEDPYCTSAAECIQRACNRADVAVHFLIGGTQCNLTLISAALRPHQCVLCVETAHINTHETGAIEACGHKVYYLPGKDGKLSAEEIEAAYLAHWNDTAHEHIPQPKLVYISNPTELGTLYSLSELEAIGTVCQSRGLYLYMDGARLGYGLMAAENDLDLMAIARLCDAFYIGGTKVGTLFGEAMVIAHPTLKEDFRCIMKQKGALLAKGRMLGIQFEALFRDGLYFSIAAHANAQAIRIRDAFIAKGFPMLTHSGANQQFVILPDALLERLDAGFTYAYICRVDERHSAIRFCTSWATRPADVDTLLEAIACL